MIFKHERQEAHVEMAPSQQEALLQAVLPLEVPSEVRQPRADEMTLLVVVVVRHGVVEVILLLPEVVGNPLHQFQMLIIILE